MLTIDAKSVAVEDESKSKQSGRKRKSATAKPTRNADTITSSELARELGVTPQKITVYKKMVIRANHPYFEGYERRRPLSTDQADLIKQCRIWIEGGDRGIYLIRKILTFGSDDTTVIEQIREYCEDNDIINGQRLSDLLTFIKSLLPWNL